MVPHRHTGAAPHQPMIHIVSMMPGAGVWGAECVVPGVSQEPSVRLSTRWEWDLSPAIPSWTGPPFLSGLRWGRQRVVFAANDIRALQVGS